MLKKIVFFILLFFPSFIFAQEEGTQATAEGTGESAAAGNIDAEVAKCFNPQASEPRAPCVQDKIKRELEQQRQKHMDEYDAFVAKRSAKYGGTSSSGGQGGGGTPTEGMQSPGGPGGTPATTTGAPPGAPQPAPAPAPTPAPVARPPAGGTGTPPAQIFH